MKTKACVRRSFPLTLAALLSLSTAAFAAPIESKLSQSLSVQPRGLLTVDSDRGSIEITTYDGSEMKIEVRRRVSGLTAAKAEELFRSHDVTFDQEGDRVQIHAKFKPDPYRQFGRRGLTLEVTFLISVPTRFNLDLHTAAGSISVTDIEGTVKARTAGGDLKFAAIKGTLDGETSAGSVTATRVTGVANTKTSGGNITLGEMGADTTARTAAGSITVTSAKARLTAVTSGGNLDMGELAGPAELKTSAGSIHVKSAQARLEAKTSGGNITIDDARDTVTADTSAGAVAVSFSAQPQADCRLTTSGGNIDVKLDAELGFDLDARTSGGRVVTDLPVTATVVGEHKNDVLQGKLNNGGKALVLNTSTGNIRLQKR